MYITCVCKRTMIHYSDIKPVLLTVSVKRVIMSLNKHYYLIALTLPVNSVGFYYAKYNTRDYPTSQSRESKGRGKRKGRTS